MAAVEDALLEVFLSLAARQGVPAVIVLSEHDVAAQGTAAGAALAHGLLGLVRALALEGFTVNALGVGDGEGAAEAEWAWVERLSAPQGISGQLVRLTTGGVGRIVP